MKTLLTILGPNGVGKTTTAKMFVEQYSNAAYVDAEWCRSMNPFAFTDETKRVVTENIYCLLRNYFSHNEIDIVVFPYGWHGARKKIYDDVIERLKKDNIGFREHIFILTCSETEIKRRALQDGRDGERIKRGIENTFNFYNNFDYPSVDTTNMTPYEVAKNIRNLVQQEGSLV